MEMKIEKYLEMNGIKAVTGERKSYTCFLRFGINSRFQACSVKIEPCADSDSALIHVTLPICVKRCEARGVMEVLADYNEELEENEAFVLNPFDGTVIYQGKVDLTASDDPIGEFLEKTATVTINIFADSIISLVASEAERAERRRKAQEEAARAAEEPVPLGKRLARFLGLVESDTLAEDE